MLTIDRTKDKTIIHDILTDPAIYDAMTDDLSPTAADFAPGVFDMIWYLVVHDGEDVAGLFVLIPENGICFEIHTCLLPRVWGPSAVQIAALAEKWIWENTPCRRLITKVPQFNRLALRFALAAGMREYGINERSFLKDGFLHDQVLLGKSKLEETPCQQSPQ